MSSAYNVDADRIDAYTASGDLCQPYRSNGTSVDWDEFMHPQSVSFVGVVSRVGTGAYQGAAYQDGTIYQICDGGFVQIIPVATMRTYNTFQLPTGYGSDHFNCVDFIGHDLMITNDGGYCYVYDISNKTAVTVTAIADGVPFSGCGGYDPSSKVYYKAGYIDIDSSRSHVRITPIDLSSYPAFSVGEPFDIPAVHLQDGAFYGGKLYLQCDRPYGLNSGAYSIFGYCAVDVGTHDAQVFNIPLPAYSESESLCATGNGLIAMYCVNWNSAYYYSTESDA